MSAYHRKRLQMLDQARRKKSLDSEDLLITCGENAHEFLLQTGMHGLRYVGDSKLTAFERFFFTAAIATMFGLAAYFISNVYHKWTESPIITTLNSVSTSISEIPFPAVTICNMNQARKSVVQNITKGSKEYHMLRSLCRYEIDEHATAANDTNWEMFRELIIQVSQSCKDILVLCRFAQDYEICMDVFETVLTDEGLCCTFNSAHKNYTLLSVEKGDDFDGLNETNKAIGWTPEEGFSDPERMHTYPRRAFGSGSHMGLSLMINAQTYDYYCSSTDSIGFKVLLHLPTELPKISNFGFSITPGRESRVVVTPSLSDASNQIRKIPPKQRQCIFQDESHLKYFRVYSQKNCEMECESRLLEAACGCVLYYMPKFGDNPTICNRGDIECYSKVLFAIEMVLNETFRCDCLPGCFDVTYTSSISTSELTPGMIFLESGVYVSTPENTKENMAIMHVFYTNKFFRSQSKEELIGFTDFLSNIGGLLGLFMGFSVLSLIEIIYFFTIRPYCAVKTKQTKRRDSSEHVVNTEDRRVWTMERNMIKRFSTQSENNAHMYYVNPKVDGSERRTTIDNEQRVYLD